MPCPRCGGTLTTFTVDATDRSAEVCESCGFAGVPTSHRSDGDETESWEQVMARFDGTLPSARTARRDGEVVTAPADDPDPRIDPGRLDESVPVGHSLRDGREAESEETDGD